MPLAIVPSGRFCSSQSCTPGQACTGNDPCYAGGVYDANCGCVGEVFQDNDGDGFCAAEDSDDNNPCVPDNSGCGGGTGGGASDCQELSSVGFEGNQLGIWNDGGSSARLLNSSTFAPTGQYSFYIQADNGVSSSLFSNSLDLENSSSLEVSFSYYPYNMEQGDRFHFEIDSGSGYETYQTYVAGTDFTNEQVTTESFSIPSS